MWLFKRRKKEQKTAEGNGKVAGYIAGGLLKVQSGWAGWMQRQSEKLGTKGKKVALVLCCLFTLSYSTIIIVKGLNGDRSIGVSRSSIKPPMMLPEDPEPEPGKAEIHRLKQFRRYLDSLAADVNGRKVYDSLLHARPGLIDSLEFVEQAYQLR